MPILPFFFLAKSCRAVRSKHDEDTADHLWATLVHILQSGLRGIHPERDAFGDAWRSKKTAALGGTIFCHGKFKLVVWTVTGDLEFLSNELGLNHMSSNNPCWLCHASRDPGTLYPITDVSRHASWKSAPREDVAGEPCHASEHPLFGLEYLVRQSFPGDLMHSGCLGVVQYFVGSALVELTHHSDMAPRPELANDTIWGLIQDVYQKMGLRNRLTRLTVEMYMKAKSWPRLSTKAAESQTLLFVVRDILEQLLVNDNSEHSRHRLRSCEALCTFYRIVRDSPMVPSPEQASQMKRAVETHLVHSNWLLDNAVKLGYLAYPIQLKHHMLWHLADLGQFQNPRVAWCYDFEDWVGDVITAAKACMAGTPMHLVGNKVVQHFLLGLQIMISLQT